MENDEKQIINFFKIMIFFIALLTVSMIIGLIKI